MSTHFERARLLYDQGRLDMAEAELRLALVSDPNESLYHSFLAMCLSDQEKFKEATEEARQGVHLAPDSHYSHFVMAYVLFDRNRLEEARSAMMEALRLRPDEAMYWSLLANLEARCDRWRQSLEAAERGLQVDAEHVGCANARAMALVHLGRKDEAGATIDAALSRDPENAFTHANMGWALLHRGRHEQAMEHFRESLRLDPDMEPARAGIVEAMKARNLVYRWLLKYFLWMSRLSDRAQWGVIIGLYFVIRVLRAIAKSNPELQPFLLPLLVVYAAFMLMTWIGEPLFNLLLRFNRFGRLALSPDQMRSTHWLLFCLGVALPALVVFLWLKLTSALVLAIVSAAMCIPITATVKRPRGWPRNALVLYTAGMAVLGGIAVGAASSESWSTSPDSFKPLFNVSIGLFAIAWFLFGWVANAVSMARVKR